MRPSARAAAAVHLSTATATATATATTSAAVAAVAWASAVVGRRTWVGRQLSGCVVAIIAAYGLAAVGVLPLSSRVYEFIGSQLVPVAAALVMLEGRGSAGSEEGGGRASLACFGIGALATVTGTLVAYRIAGAAGALGADGWKVASALCSSYIGGSINFAATSAALGGPGGTLAAAAMGVDNLLMACFIATCMRIPAAAGAAAGPASHDAAAGGAVSVRSIVASIAAAGACLGAARALATLVRMPALAFGMVTVLASFVPVLVPRLARGPVLGAAGAAFAGASSMGGAILMLYFVTIGAVAGGVDGASLVLQYSRMFLFTSTLLATHLTVTLAAGRAIFGFPMRMLLTVSNACVGGPGTALAMAETRGCVSWVFRAHPHFSAPS